MLKKYMQEGRAYLKRKDYDLAIGTLRQALDFCEKDEDKFYAYIELGVAYREKGKYDLAIKEFETALEYNPKNARIFVEIGRLYQYQKKFSLAIEKFQQAVQSGYVNGDIHMDLGFSYYHQGDYTLAIEHLNEAISLGVKNNIDIYFYLGRAYRENRQYQQSVEILSLAYKLPSAEEAFFRNKILNEIEISQRKTVLESKPIGLWVNLTTRCNLRCIMCEVWKTPWDIPESAVEEIAGYFPYLEELYWQGGEVFLSKYFEELFDKATSYPHLKQNINTNGILVDERWAKKLARKNISLAYAIDGIVPKTYEHIRRGAKFEDLIKSIETIKKYKRIYNEDVGYADKMITIMSFIVMRSNYREIEKTIDFAKTHGFDLLQLNPIEGVVDLENIFLHKDQEALEYINKAVPEILSQAKDYGIVLDVRVPLKEGCSQGIIR